MNVIKMFSTKNVYVILIISMIILICLIYSFNGRLTISVLKKILIITMFCFCFLFYNIKTLLTFNVGKLILKNYKYF